MTDIEKRMKALKMLRQTFAKIGIKTALYEEMSKLTVADLIDQAVENMDESWDYNDWFVFPMCKHCGGAGRRVICKMCNNTGYLEHGTPCPSNCIDADRDVVIPGVDIYKKEE